MTVRIAIIDDHPLFREGVRRSLSEWPDLSVIAEGGSSADAIRIASEMSPAVMLIDISMPGNGLEAIREIARQAPDVRVIMLTVSERNEHVAEALKHGAKGYVLKGIGGEGLADAVRTVANGGTYVAPTLSASLFLQAETRTADEMEQLTAREKDVLRLVASGLSNKRIAIALDLNEKTIKHHMTRILAKLGVENRTEAALAFQSRMSAGLER